ncbi:MAG: hypothetical protein ABI203_10655 [Mucilaginibacter sp.]
MKTIEKKSPGQVSKKPAKRYHHKTEELKTDPPISEKDEVKKAEQRTREMLKKH